MLTCRTVAEPAGAPAGDMAASGCVGLGSGGRGAGSGSAWNRGPSSPPACMSPKIKTHQKVPEAAGSLTHSRKLQSPLLGQIHCDLACNSIQEQLAYAPPLQDASWHVVRAISSRTHRGHSWGPERPGARLSQARQPWRQRRPAPSAGGLRH